MELYIVWKEYHEDKEAWRRGTIRSPEKPKLALFWIGMGGAGLVAIGVAGEVAIGVHVGTLQTDLRSENRKLNDITLSAASGAMIRAAELEALIQPRYLTKEQQESIRTQLSRYAGVRFLIVSHRTDVESRRLALQIKSSLNNAGMGMRGASTIDRIGRFPSLPIGLIGGFEPDSTIHTGVEVLGANNDVVNAVVAALSSVSARRIPKPTGSENFSDSDPVALFVGLKPETDPGAVSTGIDVLKLDTQIRVQGRRWLPIEEIAPTLSVQLKEFHGQTASLVPCGPANRIDSEMSRVVSALWTMLEKAEWQRSELLYDANCTGGASLMVLFNSGASLATSKAANLLALQLNLVLPNTSPTALPIGPAVPIGGGPIALRFLAFDKAATNRELIVIAVGPHP